MLYRLSLTPPAKGKPAIDQMRVYGPATPEAYRQFASEMGFLAGGKRSRLLMSHTNLLNVVTIPHRICDSVESVTGELQSSLDSGINKNIDQECCYLLSRHLSPFSKSGTYRAHAIAVP